MRNNKPLLVWCFSSKAGAIALTQDRNGGNLPADDGPWQVIAFMSLGDDIEEERHTKERILEQGFCYFPDPERE